MRTYNKILLTLRTFATCLLTMMILGSRSQELNQFTYSHLGMEDGMHSQRVYSILQTSDGAIWWGTKNGVERYNGVTIRHYQLGEQDKYSNDAGRIIKLLVDEERDSSKSLYAYDDKGFIFVYDAATDRFKLKVNIREMVGGEIRLNDICPTEQGLWTATNQGIYILDGRTAKVVTKDVYANCIVRTEKNLIFCTRSGIFETAVTSNGTEKPRKIAAGNMESGYYDPLYDKVWLGGFSSGLYVLDNNGELTRVSQKESAWQQPIRSICPYNSKTMLIGIDGKGVHWIDRRPDEQGQYKSGLLFDANEGPQGVLHGNGIYSMICDSWENIVIGSYSGGIDIARPVGSTSAVFRHEQNNQQSLLNNHVNCVLRVSSSLMAMGTDNGVSLFNPQTGFWQHTCRDIVVLSLCKTPNGSLLAATYGNGVYEIAPSGSAHPLYNEENGTIQDNHVFSLLFDRKGDLWMGCLDGALVQKTPAGCKYHQVKYVNALLELPNGHIAVGTAYGLWIVDPVTGKVNELNYQADRKDDVNRFILSLLLNGTDELWIGTDGGGAYIYNLQTKKCRQMTTEDGLPSNSVRSLCKDHFNRIMIATEHGLAFVKPNQPTKAVDVNYCYGLGCEYTNGASTILGNNHILLGTTSGAIIINPENIQEINYLANLRLTSVNCSDDDDDSFKEETYQMLQDGSLKLPYDKQTFVLNFESINLRNQFDIVYQYQVAGGEWSQPIEQQYIRFTNLEPGNHRLRLRAISRTSGTVLDELELTIHIGQPWWKSWWMMLIYCCLIILAFYGAWRIYQLHTKYMRLVVSNPQLNADLHQSNRFQTESSAISQPLPSTEADEQTEEGNEFISKVTRLVIDNLSDSDFSIDRLCQEMAMSRTLFYIKLKSYTGKSPQDFIRVIRLERAVTLLRNGQSVTDTATLTGFENAKYFSTVFKKYFGVSPSKFC